MERLCGSVDHRPSGCRTGYGAPHDVGQTTAGLVADVHWKIVWVVPLAAFNSDARTGTPSFTVEIFEGVGLPCGSSEGNRSRL